MEEKVGETLDKLASILHWLGKYREANIVQNLSVVCKLSKIETKEEVKTWRENLENCTKVKDTKPEYKCSKCGKAVKPFVRYQQKDVLMYICSDQECVYVHPGWTMSEEERKIFK